jgi:hypothetical protein
MLTAGRGRAKPVAGEELPHCGKASEIRTSGLWYRGQAADDSAASNIIDTPSHLPWGARPGYSAINRWRMGHLSGKCQLKYVNEALEVLRST